MRFLYSSLRGEVADSSVRLLAIGDGLLAIGNRLKAMRRRLAALPGLGYTWVICVG